MPLAAPTAIFIRVCQDSGWEFGVASVQFNEQTDEKSRGRKVKPGVLLEREISLTRAANPLCSFFLFFFLHIFFVHLPFCGPGIVAGFFLFFFLDSDDVTVSSASRTAPPQKPRNHFLFFFLFASDASCVSSLFALPQTPRIHEQQHAHLRRLQLRRFLQPHLLAELSSPMELPDRRESGRAPSCRSLHANEEQQEDAKIMEKKSGEEGSDLNYYK